MYQNRMIAIAKIHSSHGLRGAFKYSSRLDYEFRIGQRVWIGREMLFAFPGTIVQFSDGILQTNNFMNPDEVLPFIHSHIWLEAQQNDETLILDAAVFTEQNENIGYVDKVFSQDVREFILIKHKEQCLSVPLQEAFVDISNLASHHTITVKQYELFKDLWE